MAKSTSSLVSTISTSSSTSASSSSSSSSATSTTSSGRHQLHLKSASSIDRRKRLAANARERKRMHLLNKAYDELRLRLADAENKSKYDVLVQAKEYIQALAAICEKFDQQNPNHHLQAASGNKHSVNTTPIDHHHHHHHHHHHSKPVDMTAKPYSSTANHLKPDTGEQPPPPKGALMSHQQQAYYNSQRLSLT